MTRRRSHTQIFYVVASLSKVISDQPSGAVRTESNLETSFVLQKIIIAQRWTMEKSIKAKQQSNSDHQNFSFIQFQNLLNSFPLLKLSLPSLLLPLLLFQISVIFRKISKFRFSGKSHTQLVQHNLQNLFMLQISPKTNLNSAQRKSPTTWSECVWSLMMSERLLSV